MLWPSVICFDLWHTTLDPRWRWDAHDMRVERYYFLVVVLMSLSAPMAVIDDATARPPDGDDDDMVTQLDFCDANLSVDRQWEEERARGHEGEGLLNGFTCDLFYFLPVLFCFGALFCRHLQVHGPWVGLYVPSALNGLRVQPHLSPAGASVPAARDAVFGPHADAPTHAQLRADVGRVLGAVHRQLFLLYIPPVGPRLLPRRDKQHQQNYKRRRHVCWVRDCSVLLRTSPCRHAPSQSRSLAPFERSQPTLPHPLPKGTFTLRGT